MTSNCGNLGQSVTDLENDIQVKMSLADKSTIQDTDVSVSRKKKRKNKPKKDGNVTTGLQNLVHSAKTDDCPQGLTCDSLVVQVMWMNSILWKRLRGLSCRVLPGKGGNRRNIVGAMYHWLILFTRFKANKSSYGANMSALSQ